jgi:type VI protein secretion system component VasK
MAKKDKNAEEAAPAEAAGIRLSAHPRARRHIAIAKGWGGLIAFAVVLKLARGAGLPWADAIERGVLGGIVGYLAAWMIVQTIWRHLALAELEDLRRRLVARAETQASARETSITEAQKAAQAAMPQS